MHCPIDHRPNNWLAIHLYFGQYIYLYYSQQPGKDFSSWADEVFLSLYYNTSMFCLLFWPDPDQIMPVAMLSSTHIYLEYYYVVFTYMHFTFDISKRFKVDIIND